MEEVQKYQRNINSLTDPDRSTRLRGLQALQKEFFGGNSVTPDMLHDLFKNAFGKPLLRLFADPVEKIRETSVNFVISLVNTLGDPSSELSLIVPSISSRLNVLPFPEPAEEIRLLLVTLIEALVVRCGRAMGPFLEDIMPCIGKALTDNFPDVKRGCCSGIMHLSQLVPDRTGLNAKSVLAGLMVNFSHQHSKVRRVAVEALGALMLCDCASLLEECIPPLKLLTNDRIPSVREGLYLVVATWLEKLAPTYLRSFDAKLFPLLLAGVTDETPELRTLSVELLDKLGHFRQQLAISLGEDLSMADTPFIANPPPPFIARPNLGLRYTLRRLLDAVLPPLLSELADWKVQDRVRAAGVLHTLLVCVEEDITRHLDVVLQHVYKTCRDDELAVATQILQDVKLIGTFVSPDQSIPLILDHLRGSTQVQQSPAYRSSCLLILGAVLEGMESDKLAGHLSPLVGVFAEPDLCRSENPDLLAQLAGAVAQTIATAGPLCAAERKRLFSVLLSLESAPELPAIRGSAKSSMSLLANLCGLRSAEDLYDQHLAEVLPELISDHYNWHKHSSQRFMFDTLLRNAGAGVAGHWPVITTVMCEAGHSQKDVEVRMDIFALLESFILDPKLHASIAPHLPKLLNDLLIPNAVWKAGKSQIKIRKASIVCLYQILEQPNLMSSMSLLPNMDQLLPVIKSCMDDDWAPDLRFAVCRLVDRMLTVMKGVITDDQLRDLYPELLKRLDDSNDGIRMEAARAMLSFFSCLPSDWSPSLFQYIVKTLFVHLDDPSEQIEACMIELLRAAAKHNPQLFIEEGVNALAKHRHPRRCEEVLQYARSLSS
eukprot:GILJ01007461.1.p1 GENE.GILJ01007461.1~~GILJ01007461.1.p1  ORF type:complete len:843 (-),score=129.06 GILJ01007461.1:37-2523(-)